MKAKKPKPDKKPRQVEPDDESLAYVIAVGHAGQWTERDNEDEPLKKAQIGFIRQRKASRTPKKPK